MSNRINLKHEVLIRDALTNYRLDSGSSDVYCRGLLVGVIAGVMAATGKDWTVAIQMMALCMPYIKCRKLTKENVPESWLRDFQSECAKVWAARMVK